MTLAVNVFMVRKREVKCRLLLCMSHLKQKKNHHLENNEVIITLCHTFI